MNLLEQTRLDINELDGSAKTITVNSLIIQALIKNKLKKLTHKKLSLGLSYDYNNNSIHLHFTNKKELTEEVLTILKSHNLNTKDSLELFQNLLGLCLQITGGLITQYSQNHISTSLMGFPIKISSHNNISLTSKEMIRI